MPGGLIQLIAYGAEDVYISGEPQATYFKSVYRRHTPFSIQSIRQQISNRPNWGTEHEVVIEKVGDLVGRMWFEAPTSRHYLYSLDP